MSGDDLTRDADEALLSLHDAAELGFKLAEMADRVKAVDPAVPGTVARWRFVMDGISYDVVLTKSK